MELIYTNQLDGFDSGKRYRNPDLFRSVERGVSKVVIIGDYPEIEVAYAAADVEVEVQSRKVPVTSAPGKRKTRGKRTGTKERTTTAPAQGDANDPKPKLSV
ncbi:hypothetical protein ACI2KS_10670 [Pseudomonas sp. NPDC087358]|uniref:hypothetical protein n=1 Tax=Pseudomonas sp. NPDC087358 TaxID=3364439 RepID=UPI003850F1AD